MNLSVSIRSAIIALVLAAGLAPLKAQTPPAATPPATAAARTAADAEADADNRIMAHGIFAKLAATPISIEGRRLDLIDAGAGLTPATLEAVRAELQQNLGLPVRLGTAAGTDNPFAAGLAALRRDPVDSFAAVLIATQPVARMPALAVAVDERLVIVNVAPLAPSDQLAIRIGKLAMRGLGLVYGLALVDDPFSVMRPLGKGLADLDTLSRSFAPEESLKFNVNAEARGFPIRINPPYFHKVQKGLMPPINPARWPVWEKKHGKQAAETFRKNGFDPEEIANEYQRLRREGKTSRADRAGTKTQP